jgi:integrator complex subunit 6
VGVRGGGRPLSEGDEHFLSIGILHLPENSVSLTSQTAGGQFSSLTLLPPEPHILLPLLIKAAEAEHRAIKKASESKEASERPGQTAGFIQKPGGISGAKNVHLDEHWRSEFRAYLFRVPVYYHNALKRSLRHILPASAHSMLSLEGIETVAAQCFSKLCLQKIRSAEQQARETNERLERQEAELRRHGINPTESTLRKHHGDDSRGLPIVGYGQYDPRTSTASYLAALRNMPAPWRVGAPSKRHLKDDDAMKTAEVGSQDGRSEAASVVSGKGEPNLSMLDM